MTEETKAFLRLKSEAKDKAFSVFLDPDFDSLAEYKAMMRLLSGKSFELTDFSWIHEENGDLNPPTFGERLSLNDEDHTPGETTFTHSHDYFSEQALDYILKFWKLKYQESLNNSIELQLDEEAQLTPNKIPLET